MIKYVDSDGIAHDVFITDNNYRPGQLADDNGVISDYYTNTVSGTDGIVVEHTYNDKIDLMKIYGKSVQDGVPSPDNPVEIQSVGGTLTVSSLDGTQAVTMEIPTLYGVGDVSDVLYVDRAQGRAWVERKFGTVSVDDTNQTSAYASYQRYGVSFTLPNALPEGFQLNLYLANRWLYNGTGIARNDIWFNYVDSRKLFWMGIWDALGIEFPDIDAFNAWFAGKTLDSVYLLKIPYIEELDYTPLPTYPHGTVVEIDSDVVPVVEVTAKGYLADDYNNVTATALIALGVEPSADQAENLEMLTELGVNPYA